MSKGKINCEIQIPENADKTIRNSALTLGHFIKKISGVSPKLVQGFDESKHAIQLGMKRDFKSLVIPAKLESLSDEAFYVKTFKNKTIICGKSYVAVRHGVYTLLRKLGCRWYFPGSDWKILPRSANIDIALNVIDSPSYDISRHIVYGMFSPGNFNSEFRKWYEANRLGSAMGGSIKHSYSSFVPYSLYDKHPEYFSMKDTDKDGKGDKRVKVQPCTTHPEVIKMFINGAKKALAKNPNAGIYPVSPNDNTTNMCRCERCCELGSYSDCAYTIAKQVAEAVKDDYPNVIIGLYAYGVVAKPPTIKSTVQPNMLVELATAYKYGTTVDEMLEKWPKYAKHTGIRDYYSIRQWGDNSPGKGLQPSEAKVEIPEYYRKGARDMNAEAICSWASPGRGTYLATELLWNVDADSDRIMDRFYKDCFGEGAEDMKEYFESWEKDKTFNYRSLKLALLNIKSAFMKAKNHSEKRRIVLMGLYMHERKLMYDLEKSKKESVDEKTEQILREGDKFIWRYKNTGMTYNRSGWDVYKSVKPYFTLQEAVNIIDEDLELLKEIPALKLKTNFSENLVDLPADISVPGLQGSNKEEGLQSSLTLRSGKYTYFFYVPKNTEGFEVHTSTLADREMEIEFINAKNQTVIKVVSADGDKIIMVPADSSAQVWAMKINAPAGKNKISLKGVPKNIAGSIKKLKIPEGL